MPSENPAELATALRSALADPTGSAARATAARLRLARDFAEGPWLERYEETYREVIRSRRGV